MAKEGNQRRGGRILPHQWETDDNAPLLGANLAIAGNYQQQYNETLEVDMDNKARKESRCES